MENKLLEAFNILHDSVKEMASGALKFEKDLETIRKAPGPQGDAGTRGERGPGGDAGPDGRDGRRGDTGSQGVGGLPGRDGPEGPQGEHGPVGAAGDSGSDGKRGEPGRIGERGPRGGPGPRGPKGSSITGVSMVDNEMFITRDGKKESIGKVRPGVPFVGGGGIGYQAPAVEAVLPPDFIFAQPWTLPSTNAPSPTYVGGFYAFESGADNFATPTTLGVVNNSEGAHFMVVVGEVPIDNVTLTITGDTKSDTQNYIPSDTVDLIIPAGTPINTYLETPSKFLGQASVVVSAGTPVNCNFGFCKYWDNWNNDFSAVGVEAVYLGDLTATVNIELLHHTSVGWTYNAGGEPVTPPPLISMVDVQGPNVATVSNRHGCFKHLLETPIPITGGNGDGVLVRFTFSAGACIEFGHVAFAYNQ